MQGQKKAKKDPHRIENGGDAFKKSEYVNVNAGGIVASSVGEITVEVIMLPFRDAECGASDSEYTPIKEVKDQIAEQIIYRAENEEHTHSNRGKGRKMTNARRSDVSSIRDLVKKADKKHQRKDKEGENSRLAPDLKEQIA